MTIAAVLAAVGLMLPATAGATDVNVVLTSQDGEGSFNATLPCPIGDGPNWRYQYTGGILPGGNRLTDSIGPLSGAWSGSFEVHDANNGYGFLPAGGSRLALQATHGGTARFELANGSCAEPALSLAEERAQGFVPVTAAGGTGAARGLTGEGFAYLDLELSPGADNAAYIELSGDFDVDAPQLQLASVTARWASLADYLNRRLTVTVTARNSGPGDAFDVSLTGNHPPIDLGALPLNQQKSASFTLANAAPGRAYTLTTTIAARDGLDAPQPATAGSASYRAPSLP